MKKVLTTIAALFMSMAMVLGVAPAAFADHSGTSFIECDVIESAPSERGRPGYIEAAVVVTCDPVEDVKSVRLTGIIKRNNSSIFKPYPGLEALGVKMINESKSVPVGPPVRSTARNSLAISLVGVCSADGWYYVKWEGDAVAKDGKKVRGWRGKGVSHQIFIHCKDRRYTSVSGGFKFGGGWGHKDLEQVFFRDVHNPFLGPVNKPHDPKNSGWKNADNRTRSWNAPRAGSFGGYGGGGSWHDSPTVTGHRSCTGLICMLKSEPGYTYKCRATICIKL